MSADLATTFATINTPGVRQVLESDEGLNALTIGRFHAAFAAATKAMIVESDFRQHLTKDLANGKYLESGLINHFVTHARYSVDCMSQHQLLPDCYSYRIDERPRINDRTWYTRVERRDAAMLCAERPLIPLAHMMLFSIAVDRIFDAYFADPTQAKQNDFTSFIIRWNPDNTSGELVPAVAIMYLRSRGFPSSEKAIEELTQSASQQEIEDAYRDAKDFIVKGGFFSLPLLDHQGERVKVTCPGMAFMRTYWDTQAEIYAALTRDSGKDKVVAWSESLRRVYRTALTEDNSAPRLES